MRWFRPRAAARRAPGYKSPPRRNRRLQRWLQFEPLENRRLLAKLVLDVRFLQDSNGDGEPDQETTGPMQVGDAFWAEVRVQDQRTGGGSAPGVIALPLNVSWSDPAVVTFAGQEPTSVPNSTLFSIPNGNLLVTDNFPLQRFVNTDGSEGTFLGLRGAAIPNAEADSPNAGSAIGTTGLEQFSLIKLTAAQAGTACFSVQLAGSMSFADAAVLENEPSVARACMAVTASSVGLSGFVYVDANNDGVRDVDANGMPVDLPVPNVEIKLFQEGQAEFVAKVTTGPDGWYHFEDLTPGTKYTIRETPPTGLVDGKETLGTIIQEGQTPTSSGATAGQDEFSNIVLAANQRGIDFNFGELGVSVVNKRLFLASTPTGEELVCKPLISAAFVQGTAGDDTITVDDDGESIRVLITPENQVVYGPQQLKVFPLSQVKMVSIDALGGSDTVTINGSSADEVAHLQPGTVTLRKDVDPLSDGYGVKVKNAEDITVTAGSGTDWAVIRDAPGNEALTSSGNTVVIDWNGGKLTAKATGFDAARAITQSNEQDTAKEQAGATTVLKLLGKWKKL